MIKVGDVAQTKITFINRRGEIITDDLIGPIKELSDEEEDSEESEEESKQ